MRHYVLAALLGAASAALSPGLLSPVTNLLSGAVNILNEQVDDITVVASALLNELDDLQPTATPSSIEDVVSVVQSVAGAHPTAFLQSAVELVLNGLGPDSLSGVLEQYSEGSNSVNNTNKKEPDTAIFPSVDSEDAPYSVSEKELRAAIHIPDTFTYGKKPPVVLVPATAAKGGLCYESNLAKLLPQTDYADPIWLNIPGWSLETVPWNSQFVAYAINYIAGITSQNVSVIALSQGNLNTQWAFQYWPSTRSVVNDYIAVSPDYHGSILLNALCPKVPLLSCPPAVSQQLYNAELIESFRSVGAASAYVPTTTVYTGTDDVVQPQHGKNASAHMDDERGVGVTNVELQLACPLLSPALVGTHESPLWGAPLQALIKDALTHDGPADIDRIEDWKGECSKIAADGLDLADVVGTTSAIPVVFAIMFLYPHRVYTEPSLPEYVQ